MLKGIKWSVVPLPCFSLWPKSSFGKQGSGPDRGQSPVEWEDFPYVCPSICLSIHTSPLLSIKPGLRPSQPGLKPEAWGLAGPQARLDGPEGGTYVWMEGLKISPFYKTLSPIGAAAQKRFYVAFHSGLECNFDAPRKNFP